MSATVFLFLCFSLKTRDRSELPVCVSREHSMLLNCVCFVFCKIFMKKGSVMTKFTIKNSLLYLLGCNVHIGLYTQQWLWYPFFFLFFFLHLDIACLGI